MPQRARVAGAFEHLQSRSRPGPGEGLRIGQRDLPIGRVVEDQHARRLRPGQPQEIERLGPAERHVETRQQIEGRARRETDGAGVLAGVARQVRGRRDEDRALGEAGAQAGSFWEASI